MGAKREGEDFGRQLPGTGGDFIDGTDVEGHGAGDGFSSKRDGDGFSSKRDGDGFSSKRDADGFSSKRGTEDDVEGHRTRTDRGDDFSSKRDGDGFSSKRGAEGDGFSSKKLADEDDVEGHLYRNLPTTQGEIARRGPGENPHGDR